MAKSGVGLIAENCQRAVDLALLQHTPKFPPLSVPTLKCLLDNGLARGIIAEITGSRSSGRTSLASNVLAQATGKGEICAVIDLHNSFDPASASDAGIALDRLVWVRCSGNAEHAMRAADLLLHAGGFGVVLLDVCDANPRVLNRIPISYWHRFRRAIEHTPSILLICAEAESSEVIVLDNHSTRPQNVPLVRPGSVPGPARLRFECSLQIYSGCPRSCFREGGLIMYACLHGATDVRLLALAFSPEVEETDESTCVFSITPLRKLLGSPHQIASEICRVGFERKIQANLAVAANPDTAILLARFCLGVTLVTPGEERLKLGPLPLSSVCADPTLLQVLHRWGVKTCEELAALPEKGVLERLGIAGLELWRLVRGQVHRPLRLGQETQPYIEQIELEHPISLLEPLLFLFARALNNLSTRLRSQSQAVRTLKLQLKLEDRDDYTCELEFPVPLQESATMLKLLQLHLERHSPQAPIRAFTVELEPVAPRRIQGGFFVPPTPPADKLQVTLSRIAGMVGENNVGTPRLLDTHRPDAFEFIALNTAPPPTEAAGPDTLRLTMRLFRPALEARVILANDAPKHVLASNVKGEVMKSAGPWKTSGDWWTPTPWTREEWDVALDDGALYRIYQQPDVRAWYIGAVYD